MEDKLYALLSIKHKSISELREIDSLLESYDFEKSDLLKTIVPIKDKPICFSVMHENKPIFMMKKARKGMSYVLFHEFNVGKNVCNQLREECPAFTYTYSYIRGNTPVLLTEWIEGEKLFDLFKRLNKSEFLELLLQLESALNYAYKRFSFTHYDLHLDNLIVQILDEPEKIKLFLEEERWLKSRFILRIIDYDMAFARISGKRLSEYIDCFERLSMVDGPYPMYDTYKFLAYSGLDLLFLRNDEVFLFIEELFKFFEPLRDRLKMFRENEAKEIEDYCHPDLSYLERTHQDFLAFLLEDPKIRELVRLE